MGWIVAEAGIIESLIIITVSALVCLITTLSLSAISTNGEVKGGGIYYIISRSLGPEFGASVGVVFACANAVAASMNTIGFCDSLNDLLGSYGLKIIDGGVNDTRIIGTIALILLVIVCAVGMEWEVKAQNVLIVIIVGAILDFLIGVFLGPQSDEDKAKGFEGFSIELLKTNLKSDYRFSEGLSQNFITVFAIFFPSVTGIQAGANISGDLKDPAKSIPKGTILAWIISMVTYIVFVFVVGGATLRDGSGLVSDVINATFPYHFDCVANNVSLFELLMSFLEFLIFKFFPDMSVWNSKQLFDDAAYECIWLVDLCWLFCCNT
jgi:solute carrier family 12 (sodium/potassium/chloride transporter), member 2